MLLIACCFIRSILRHALSDALYELLMLDVLEDAHDRLIILYIVF